MKRVILHCDMNNFFASVECLLHPELCGKNVAVCGSCEERHGIVLAKNEAAKRYGIKTGDTVFEAKRKCPSLVTVKPNFSDYIYYSRRASEIYKRYTELVEPFGIDECWLDVTGSTRLFGSGAEIANSIRNTVREELGLTVSVGVSFNKVFAKLGSDLKKPDATTVISESDFKNTVYGLPASCLLGVGAATARSLKCIGVDTVGELAATPCDTLKIRLGKNGERLWKYANGLDDAAVIPTELSEAAKSIGRGVTAVKDLTDSAQVHAVMLALSTEVACQLRKSGFLAATLQIAIRDSRLVTREFQAQLPIETANARVIEKCAFELFNARYDWRYAVRSVTVRASKLVCADVARQLGIDTDFVKLERMERIDTVTDRITEKYGKNAIKPLLLIGDTFIPHSHTDDSMPHGFSVKG